MILPMAILSFFEDWVTAWETISFINTVVLAKRLLF